MQQYHFIYKTSSESGRYYIGRHSTTNINDGYTGSGKWPRQCRKNGTKLTREIIEFTNDFEVLKMLEEEHLEIHYGRPLCMNYSKSSAGFAVGKLNPAHLPHVKKAVKERIITQEQRDAISKRNKILHADPVYKERCRIQLTKQWEDPKYRAKKSGENHHMHRPEHKEYMINNNPMFSEAARKKQSDRQKGMPKEWQKIDVDINQFFQLYMVEDKTLAEITRLTGVKIGPLRRVIKENKFFKVATRRPRGQPIATKEVLEQLYVTENKNQPEIAVILNTNSAAVHKALKLHNVTKSLSEIYKSKNPEQKLNPVTTKITCEKCGQETIFVSCNKFHQDVYPIDNKYANHYKKVKGLAK
jgi:hypothetical protein